MLGKLVDFSLKCIEPASALYDIGVNDIHCDFVNAAVSLVSSVDPVALQWSLFKDFVVSIQS